MEVINIETNNYDNRFITFTMNGKESFVGNVYRYENSYEYYAKTKDNKTAAITVKKMKLGYAGSGFQDPIYGDVYAVGSGSGPCMGWHTNLTKRNAMAIARAYMAAANQNEKVVGLFLVD